MRATAAIPALVVVLTTAVAAAQSTPGDPREARRRFHRAVELTDEGVYPAAMAEFQRVFELTRNPAVLFNVSATYEAMGDFARALDALERFEREAPAALRAARRADVEAARGRLAARTGVLVVALDLPGLRATVDGEERDLDALRAGLRVNAGPRRVALRAPGFHPREQEVLVVGEARAVVAEPLDATLSSVSVRCAVPDAEVRVDGAPVATTPVASPLAVAEGRHRVEVRRAGYRSYQVEVDARGAGAVVDAELPWDYPVDVRVGARVVVRVGEGEAVATLDDRPIALDGGVTVPPGRHTLVVARDRFERDAREVVLQPQETLTVTARLGRSAAWRAAQAAEARRAHTAGLAVMLSGAAVALGGGALALGYLDARNDAVAEANAINRAIPRGVDQPCPRDCINQLPRLTEAASRVPSLELGVGVGVAFAAVGLVAVGAGAWVYARGARPALASVSLSEAALRWTF